MTGNNTKSKADPAPKAEPAPKKEPSPKDASAAGDAAPSKAEGSEATAPKADGSEAAASPSNYSRGEGQKPVTQAYKDNWNAIYGKKTAKTTAKKRK
jgi:hypothetical protein